MVKDIEIIFLACNRATFLVSWGQISWVEKFTTKECVNERYPLSKAKTRRWEPEWPNLRFSQNVD